MILLCELCQTPLGSFEPEDLSLPLTGAMFKPLDAGFPPPFDPSADWEHLYCRASIVVGRPHRAVGWDMGSVELIRRDRVLTPEGYFVVSQGLEPTSPAPYVHDSLELAREWAAAEAALEAKRNSAAPQFESKSLRKLKGGRR